MRNFEWKNQDLDTENKEAERNWQENREERHTRLVIDEDSIYEVDLDCMRCKEREKRRRF